jgi:hypothetical protein
MSFELGRCRLGMDSDSSVSNLVRIHERPRGNANNGEPSTVGA